MAIRLSLEDLFRLAERLESRGARFYRQAAENCPDPAGRQMLADLADQEAQHEQVFTAIAQHVLRRRRSPRISPQAAARGLAVFDLVLGDLERDLRQRFRRKKTVRDILREAVEFEKDTIVFQTALANLLKRPSDRQKVQHILREELSHLLALSARLAEHRPRRGWPALLQGVA